MATQRKWWCFSLPRTTRGGGTCVYGTRARGSEVRAFYKAGGLRVGPLKSRAAPKKGYKTTTRDAKRRQGR